MLREYPVVMSMYGVGETLELQLIAEIGVRRFAMPIFRRLFLCFLLLTFISRFLLNTDPHNHYTVKQ